MYPVTRYRTVSSPSLTGRAGIALAIGAALAGMALAVQAKTRQAQRDNPPLGNFIEVDGVRLHYLERGEGQPVVLIHGNGSMVNDFELSGLIDLAANRYRVIAFDRPGYGYSARPEGTAWTPAAQAALLQKALVQLGVDKPVVVGHSWGTLVAAAMAMDFPQFVKSVVLMSGYYFPTVRADVPVMSMPAVPLLGTLMRYTISPLLSRAIWPLLLRKLFGPAQVTPTFRDRFPVWMVLRPSQLRASAAETAMMIPAATALSSRYGELQMPVSIIAGDGDRIADIAAHSERLHRALPHSRMQSIAGEGHMIHHLVPHEVMAAIDAAASGSPKLAAVA